MILKHEKKDPKLVDGRWGEVCIIQRVQEAHPWFSNTILNATGRG